MTSLVPLRRLCHFAQTDAGSEFHEPFGAEEPHSDVI